VPEDRADIPEALREGELPALPPLSIRSNPMVEGPRDGRYAATVCAIVHDEMYFLPAFLAYYRSLGADRFIILDDRSTDGTADYLGAQPDVMVVESPIRYFDEIAYDPATRAQILETRAVRLWRDQLMEDFCRDQWAAMVDPDEFLVLPDGLSLPAFAARLEAEGAEAVWGAMIDMYPAAIGDITGPAAGATGPGGFDLAAPWYFDARPHIDPARLRETPGVPRTVYPGSVARLFATWGVLEQGPLLRRLRRRISGYRYQGASMIHKTPLVRWRPGDRFRNCHVTTKPVSPAHAVAILHFKFTADLGRKIEYALKSGGYNQGSRSYRLYATLIDRMMQADAPFKSRVSSRYNSWKDLQKAGIVR
jgi:Glycosyl transferase family 2